MRTLLYFILNDVATAKLAQTRLHALVAGPQEPDGPWFVRRDRQPVESLPGTDTGQITYRDETAMGGFVAGAIAGVAITVAYGTSFGPAESTIAALGVAMLGGMLGWLLGARLGGKFLRVGLTERRLPMAPGQLVMVASCHGGSCAPMRSIVKELGGVCLAGTAYRGWPR
ncbi:hypothetical protein SAMN05216321_11429 [Cupriavidus sp. OV038]|jgi:hypothetical protein|uniref:hypothetical protein n=1 Tax=unclassified Cupriavidus TaxID=2640874 RepID=UPI0008E8ADCD|nr:MULTISPECIES: hypothetical protein [unclassified Cupriavidus]SFD22200.1 hypothetical protein SAMN05216321_11429 [Cupriavidus sp. OV038]SFP91560.1 hypothetical protein SAMN05216322_11330 [Cupriavidus sp. OV096]